MYVRNTNKCCSSFFFSGPKLCSHPIISFFLKIMLLFSESLPLECEPPGDSEFFVISALEIVTAYNREGEREKGDGR